jgi:excisionase family DNA binding protein
MSIATTTYLSVPEAASKLGVSPSTVWRWIDNRILPAERVGPRKIRIREADLGLVTRPARSESASEVAPALLNRVLVRPTAEELAKRRKAYDELMRLRGLLDPSTITATEALAIADAEQQEHDERMAGVRR